MGAYDTKDVKVDVEDAAGPSEDLSNPIQGDTTELDRDVFVPFPIELENLEDEDKILRMRSILVGAMLGGVVNAANVYLGMSINSNLHYTCQKLKHNPSQKGSRLV